MRDICLPSEVSGIEVEYMIYVLCNGDVTKKILIEQTMDIGDFVEWISFKKYENYCEAELNKRYEKKTR